MKSFGKLVHSCIWRYDAMCECPRSRIERMMLHGDIALLFVEHLQLQLEVHLPRRYSCAFTSLLPLTVTEFSRSFQSLVYFSCVKLAYSRNDVECRKQARARISRTNFEKRARRYPPPKCHLAIARSSDTFRDPLAHIYLVSYSFKHRASCPR